jgi:hypothetical protein
MRGRRRSKTYSKIFQNNRKDLAPRAALQYDEEVRRYLRDANRVVSTHVDEEGRVYGRQVNESSRNIALAGIANTAFDQPLLAMWFRERARNAAIKNVVLAGNGNDPDIRQNAIELADRASAKAYIGAIEAKDPALALKVANEPMFKKDLGNEYNETVQRLQGKADQASGLGASTGAIAKAQNDANNPAAGQPAPARESVIGQSQGQAASTIYNAVLARGYNSAEAAALVGNMKQESEFNPTAPNPKEGGIGLLQWREDRREQLESFAAMTRRSPADLSTQLDFIRYEMSGSESASARAFLNATSVEEANHALHAYIRYGDNTEPTRLAYSQAVAGGRFGDLRGPPPRVIGDTGAHPQILASGAAAPIEPPSSSGVITPASFTGQEPQPPLMEGQAPAATPTPVDPNSTQAMMAAAMKNVNDDPSLSDKAKAVAFADIQRWGAERDLADEQNRKAQEARSAKATDHVFNLLNQGDAIGAWRQADADARLAT